MKKLLFIISLFFSINSFAQTDLTKNAKVIKDTTINKTVYKLYEGSKGGKFIIVTSRNGNQYKKYFKK